MREFQAKKRFKKIVYSKVTVVILLILVLFAARATWGVYQKEKESAANALQAQNELLRLEDRQTLLNSEIHRLSTDQGIEEEIRSQFGVAKPGEHMLILVDQASTSTSTPATNQSWWQKFKAWFK